MAAHTTQIQEGRGGKGRGGEGREGEGREGKGRGGEGRGGEGRGGEGRSPITQYLFALLHPLLWVYIHCKICV